MPYCKVCESSANINNLRGGVCWECVEAQSIIEDGTDMNDICFEGSDTDSYAKLRFLVKKGWVHRCNIGGLRCNTL